MSEWVIHHQVENHRFQQEKPTKSHDRARQNVVFELGFFIGKLGRANVCSLLKGGRGTAVRLRRRRVREDGPWRRLEAVPRPID